MEIDVHGLKEVIDQSGFEILHIKPDHAIKLIDLEDYHGDPFDRMLIAQSLVEPLHLVTCDSIMAKYNANIIRV